MLEVNVSLKDEGTATAAMVPNLYKAAESNRKALVVDNSSRFFSP